jgi:peptidoglycan/xylan/chitin deacetylase (PgdA/CDA1 family)
MVLSKYSYLPRTVNATRADSNYILG